MLKRGSIAVISRRPVANSNRPRSVWFAPQHLLCQVTIRFNIRWTWLELRWKRLNGHYREQTVDRGMGRYGPNKWRKKESRPKRRLATRGQHPFTVRPR